MTEARTLVDVFFEMAAHNLPSVMQYRRAGTWHKLTVNDVYQRTFNLARAMQEWGLVKGDRVAIVSENRPEWAFADFASLFLGCLDVPIYNTLIADQMAYMLADSGCRVVFVSNVEQLEKVHSIKNKTSLEKIVLMDDVADPRAISMQSLMLSKPYKRDVKLEEMGHSIQPDDLATIIYTSGTTGTSKGVMLTHGNIASNMVGVENSFQWSTGDGYISSLPLSHITARHVDYVMMSEGIEITYCPSFDELMEVLAYVRPHNFVSVPRVYEKIRQETERQVGTGFKKRIYDWALRVGREHRKEIVAGKKPSSLSWRIADMLVYSRIQAGIGGRADCCISGGAPLGLEMAEWLADVGILIFEGYGLTETSPVISINTRDHVKLGSVGHPLSNVECKIADDGELLVRGPSVTQGYWHMPDETRNAFDDGWFKTGDIGRIDEEGFLFITDRKKDLLKTSGGKFVAPQPIENALKSNVLVAHAAVIGDKRKFAAVIIAPQFAILEEWAKKNGVAFTSRKDLIQQEKIQALYDGIAEELNARLSNFEQMKRVILVPDEFSDKTGELTPSLKLKRRVVEAKYSGLIDQMYAEAHPPEPAQVH